jgi:hypothetical protein
MIWPAIVTRNVPPQDAETLLASKKAFLLKRSNSIEQTVSLSTSSTFNQKFGTKEMNYPGMM